MKRNIILLLLLITLTNCTKKKDTSPNAFSVDIEQRNEISIFDIFNKIEMIPLQTIDSSLIVNIDKLIPYKDRFYLFDYRIQKVLVFDDSGKFLFDIGKRGSGPEEYINISDFDVYNEQVSFILPHNGTLALYDLDGKFIEKHRLPVINNAYGYLKYINNDTIAFWTYDYENKLKLYSILEKKILKEAMPEEDVIFNTFATPIFPYGNYIIRSMDNQVYEVTPQGELIKAYKWDFGSMNNPDNLKAPELTSHEKQRDYVKKIFASEVINYFFCTGGGNSEYIYTQLTRKNKQINIFYNKVDNKKYVFEQTKEGAKIYPMYWTDDYVIGICPAYTTITYDEIIPDVILDENNLLKKRSWDELDNPLLIKYYFRK